jgi:hypothetical protein
MQKTLIDSARLLAFSAEPEPESLALMGSLRHRQSHRV